MNQRYPYNKQSIHELSTSSTKTHISPLLTAVQLPIAVIKHKTSYLNTLEAATLQKALIAIETADLEFFSHPLADQLVKC